MKRFLVFFAVALLTVSSVFAQQMISRKYKVADFTGIKASYTYKITLTKGPVCSVEISCPAEIEEYLAVSSEGGILQLSTDFPHNYYRNRNNRSGNDDVYVKIQMPSLTYLDLSGASSLTGEGEFNETIFDCDLSGASSLKYLNVNADNFTFDLSGAAKAQLKGNYKNAKGDVSGAARISIEGNLSILKLVNSGAANTTYTGTSDDIYISLSGAANTILQGKTGKLQFDISGAAKLNAREMIAEDVTGDATGVGKAVVYGNRTIRVGASTSASIVYYGDGQVQITSKTNIKKGE